MQISNIKYKKILFLSQKKDLFPLDNKSGGIKLSINTETDLFIPSQVPDIPRCILSCESMIPLAVIGNKRDIILINGEVVTGFDKSCLESFLSSLTRRRRIGASSISIGKGEEKHKASFCNRLHLKKQVLSINA